MQKQELEAVFDRQAAHYDAQWARMAPIRDGLHFLLEVIFADLPVNARILCVGVGTGAELTFLARTFPDWMFTAVEPSSAMLDLCRRRAEKDGYASRCYFHGGYVDSLPAEASHDGATCFLVSQFILEQQERRKLFRAIATRLRSGALLVSSDLAADVDSDAYDALLRNWLNVMAPGGCDPERLERARAAYAKDVAILPPAVVAAIIESAGFEPPIRFYQAGLMHAWLSKRAAR
jgi:tRNA (cmo5U34)-methyltransferase